MADRNINVGINFTANTQQAQNAINQLQQSLSQITFGSAQSVGLDPKFTDQFKQAQKAAEELSYHLNNAYNATTGNFDLSRLDKSLKTSKTNVTELSSNLLKAGETGKQAFMQLAQAISQADQPIITTNKLLGDLWTTMKNTMKWQLSSSMLHGFMGAINQAMGYAKDLNGSLNDIRIVTGKSSDEMERFAEQANKSAKALSATTTDYTKASLIYYQQGLDGADVQERTDATIKMANVTGDSAEKVSSQMTAIWNNFANGSKSLEYYADVITALGAATASSSAEIAQGLEKFASVANTVGLSYEYATSALATIVATTRQSADTVGTGLRTVFSRLQSLSLGETLDDGVDLTKYSKALETVGVSVLEANGKMRDMDAILNDLAGKWEQLDQAQKVALAETVGGVRQYTNLIALMDNWDFMEKNLGVAGGAEGTLSEQADIYAESWEAARKHVKASMEAIYSDIIDDKFFINFNNGLADVIDGVDHFIDSVGGIGPIITGVGAIFLSTFSGKIEPALAKLQYNFSVLTKGAGATYSKFIGDFQTNIDTQIGKFDFTKTEQVELNTSMQMAQAKNKLAQVQDSLNEKELQGAQIQQAAIERQREVVLQLQQEADELKKVYDQKVENFTFDKDSGGKELNETFVSTHLNQSASMLSSGDITGGMQQSQAARELTLSFKELESASDTTAQSIIKFWQSSKESGNTVTELSNVFEEYQNHLNRIKEINLGDNNVNLNFQVMKEEIASVITELTPFEENSEQAKNAIETLKKALKESTDIDGLKKALTGASEQLNGFTLNGDKAEAILNKLAKNGFKNVQNAFKDFDEKTKQAALAFESFKKAVENYNPTHQVSGIEALTRSIAGLGSVAMSLNSFKSAFEALSNPDLSGLEKFSSVIIPLSMGVGMATSAFKSFQGAVSFLLPALKIQDAMMLKNIASLKVYNLNLGITTLREIDAALQKKGAADAEAAKILATSLGIPVERVAAAVEKARAKAIEEGTAVRLGDIIAELASTAATEKNNATGLKAIVIKHAETLATIGLTGATLAYIAVAALLVVGIWAIIKAVQNQKTEQEKANEEYQKSQETLKGLTDAYNEAASAANNFKSAISNYDEAHKALDTLVKGTVEWTEALAKNNDEVMKLITAYPELQAAVTSNNGVLTLDKASNVYKNYEQQINDTVQQRQNAVMAGQLVTARTKNNVDIYDLQDRINETKYYRQVSDGKGSYTNKEITKEEFDDKEFGKGWQYSYSSKRNLSIDQIREIKSAIETGQYKLTEQGYEFNSDELNSALGENTAAINELISSLKNEITVEDNLSEAMVDQVNQDNDKYTNSIAQNVIKQIGAQTIESRKEIIQDQVKNGNQLAEQYQNMFGYSNLKFEKLSNGDYSFYTEDGGQKTESFKIAEENMRTAVEETLAADLSNIDISNWERSVLALAQKLADAAGIELAEAVGLISYKDDGNKDNIVTQDELVVDTNNLTEKQAAQYYNSNQTFKEYENQAIAQDPARESEIYSQAKDRWTENQREYQQYETARKNQRLSESLSWDDEVNDDQKLQYGMQAYEMSTEDLEAYKTELKNTNKILQEHQERIEDVAEESLKNSANYDKLTKAVSDNKDKLDKNKVSASDYSKAIGEIRTATEEWLGVKVDDDFIVKNLDNIKKAAEGNTKAMWELQKAATLENIELNLDITDNTKARLTQSVNSIISEMQKLLDENKLETGMTLDEIDTVGYYNALNDMLASGQITAQELNDIFSTIGYNPKVDWDEVTMSVAEAQSRTATGFVQLDDYNSAQIANANASTEAQVTIRVPKINAAGTTYSGPKSGGAKPPASKGGGGGGNKKKDKKVDDERDRYHTVTQQLGDLNDNMEELGDLSDRAFGAEKLANMQAQVDLYDDLIAKQDQYIDEIKSYLALDTQKLFDLGLNPEFDENGVITNYDEIFEKLVNDYNSGKLDDEAYEERKKAIEKYVETNNLLQDQEAERLDMINKQKDAWLEMVNTEVELKIDIDEDKLKMLEFLLDRLSNDAWDGAERLKNFEQQIDKAVADVAAYQEGIRDLIGDEGYDALLSGNMEYLESLDLDQNTIDQLNEYKDGLLDATKEMLDAQQKMQEQVLNTFKAQDDEVQRAIDGFGNLNNVIEHYNNIVDIVGRGTVGITTDMAKKMRKVQQDNLNNVIASAKTQMEQIAAQRAIIEKEYADALADGTNGDLIRQLEEQLKEMEDMYNESHDQFLQAWEDALQAAKDIYEATIDDIFKDWEKNLSPIYGSLAALSDAFERQKMLDDDYLDDYQKVYELNKLTRDIQSSIDDTDNIAGKKELIDLQNEINELQNSDTEISEYQLEVLQKRFELKKAEIALSETENALNQVRLRQDNEGNWGYVYTADSDAVAEAESEYADKLYELQELNSQYIKDLQDNIVSTQQDMEDELKQLHIEDFDDEAAYYAAKNSIIEDYKKQMNFLFSELAAALENNQNLYDNEMVAYAQMTNTKMIDEDRYLTSFNNTVLSQKTGYENLGEYQGAFTQSTTTMANDIQQALIDMQTTNEEVFKAAGTSMKDFSGDYQQATKDIGESSEDLKGEVEELTSKAQESMKAVTEFINNWKADYSKAVVEIVKQNEALYGTLQKLQDDVTKYETEKAAQEQRAAEEEERKKQEAAQQQAAASQGSTGSGSGGGYNGYDGYYHITVDGQMYSGTSASGLAAYLAQKGKSVSADQVRAGGTVTTPKGRYWDEQNQEWVTFDTGGYTGRMEYADTGMYTGEWENGSVRNNGRLAWLHQKELVLNAHDTENMLEAVNVVRAITEAINLQALNAAMGLGEQKSAVVQKDPEQLEQTVHITAEFPSVQDRNEIEAAFENLLGKATQFANRRRN